MKDRKRPTPPETPKSPPDQRKDLRKPATYVKNYLLLQAKRCMYIHKAQDRFSLDDIFIMGHEFHELADFVSKEFLGESLEEARQNWEPPPDVNVGPRWSTAKEDER